MFSMNWACTLSYVNYDFYFLLKWIFAFFPKIIQCFDYQYILYSNICNKMYGMFPSCIQFDLYYKYWCLLGTLFLVIFVNFFKNSYADSVTRGTQRVLGYPSFYLSIYSSFHPSCQSARLEIYNFLISWTWI